MGSSVLRVRVADIAAEGGGGREEGGGRSVLKRQLKSECLASPADF